MAIRAWDARCPDTTRVSEYLISESASSETRYSPRLDHRDAVTDAAVAFSDNGGEPDRWPTRSPPRWRTSNNATLFFDEAIPANECVTYRNKYRNMASRLLACNTIQAHRKGLGGSAAWKRHNGSA